MKSILGFWMAHKRLGSVIADLGPAPVLFRALPCVLHVFSFSSMFSLHVRVREGIIFEKKGKPHPKLYWAAGVIIQ